MPGNFIYRHHLEPRVKLYSPREESLAIPQSHWFGRTLGRDRENTGQWRATSVPLCVRSPMFLHRTGFCWMVGKCWRPRNRVSTWRHQDSIDDNGVDATVPATSGSWRAEGGRRQMFPPVGSTSGDPRRVQSSGLVQVPRGRQCPTAPAQ